MLWFLALPLAIAATPEDARRAFDDWATQSAQFNAAVADLYAADARFTLLRDGAPTKTLSGSQMRALVLQHMARAKAAHERSTFDQITVQAEGDGFRIQAQRVSTRQCAVDLDFQQLWTEVDGALRIVEQQQGSVSISQCPPSAVLSAGMTALVNDITPHLPMQLDEATVLEAVTVDGRALRYSMKLATLASTKADPAMLYTEVAQRAMRGGCSDPTLRRLMEVEATVVYAYRFSDDQPLGELLLTAARCAMLR